MLVKRCAYASIVAAVIAAVLVALAAAAPVRTSHSGWTWGSPRPQGNELRAVDFASGRGFAVGEFGTILKTEDGVDWEGVRTGITDDLTKLEVVDANTFVAGGGCTLLRSTDAGQTLIRLRFNPSATCGSPLAAMHFPSRDVGYLVRGDGSVLRTDDGGARFTSRTALPGASGGPPNDAWFTSADTGVVVTGADTLGRIYRTTDGGGTWTEAATAAAVRSVYFVSPTVGWAVGQNVALKTDDGGASWTPTTVQGNLRSVRCADETHCVAVTVGNGLMYTDDGFETLNAAGLEPQCESCAVPAIAVGAAAASFQSATRVISVGKPEEMGFSNNAGKTYTFVGGGLSAGYNRLRLTSPSTVFAPGSAGSVARTTDSGATWSRVGVPTTNDIVDVAFPTSGLGYAVDTEGAVFRTDNGGGSWAILGESGARPRAITASGDGNTVLLIGPRGMRRSANGGANFDPVESAVVENAELEDVDRTGDGVIYVSGKRTVAYSTNEGQTWKAMKRPSRATILEVDFVDRKVGYVLGSDGRVWRTANRGTSWTELIGVGQSGYEIAFGDTQNGYIALSRFAGQDGGWVLHTSDGGASWRPQLVSKGTIGNGAGPLAAAPGQVAYALVGSNEMKATSSGGDAATPSTLTLSTKTRRLARKGKVRVDGKLSPSAPGARVEVIMRDGSSGKLSRRIALVRSDGSFVTNWTVKRTSSFVAQWAGDSALNSDGSPPLGVRVGRR
ncbi:MAG TPA: YCF48-related protein [Thermoleophilaceae bacterium]|jgi:photosystem II stability/assembly factor-like uncharacterized protein